MDGLDPETGQGIGGKISQIEGDDELGSSANGRSQHVTVVRVGELKVRDDS